MSKSHDMVPRVEGQDLLASTLMTSDPAVWNDEQLVSGSAALILLRDAIDERVSVIKAVAAKHAEEGVDRTGSGHPVLRAAGGSVSCERRCKRTPRIDVIAEWARANKLYDQLFQMIPTLNTTVLQQLKDSNRIPSEEYGKMFDETFTDVVKVTKPKQLVAWFKELVGGNGQITEE